MPDIKAQCVICEKECDSCLIHENNKKICFDCAESIYEMVSMIGFMTPEELDENLETIQ